jgi:Ca-activated chloride channel homolog
MKPLYLIGMLLCSATFSNAQSVAAISKGNEYYRQQQYNLAEAQYKAALEKVPTDATAQFNLANALYQQKKYDEAHAVLKKLNESTFEKPLKAKVHYNNGVVYTKEKALAQSIEAYKAALRLNPDDNDARENLQKALNEQKKQQQQREQQQRQQQKNSNMSQREAEQKLKLLQERERQLQERLQKSGQKGNSMPKDW